MNAIRLPWVGAVVGMAAALGCGAPAGRPPDAARKLRFVETAQWAGLEASGPSYAAAAADYDLDGRPDLAVSRHGSVDLRHNLGGGRFVAANGAQLDPADTHGLSWVELDRDGWLDLYVSVGAARGFGRGPNQLYRNLLGRELARDEAPPDVLADPLGRGRCSCPSDTDGDGVPELLILNAEEPDRPHRAAARRGDEWIDVAPAIGLTEIDAECLTAAHAGPGGDTLWVAYGAGDDSGRLYARGVDGRLEDVTERLGVTPGPPTVMSAAWGDVDNDGDLDLYLVCGLGIPREVVADDGRIDFRLVARKPAERPGFRFTAVGPLELDVLVAGSPRPEMVRLGGAEVPSDRLPWVGSPDDPALRGAPSLGPGSSPGVYLWRDGDELVLRFVGDGGRFRAASGRVTGEGGVGLLGELQEPAHFVETPNRLLIRQENGFVDSTDRAGVGDPSSGRDAVFADVDNDGDLDLYLVNGGTAFANQPDRLYRNEGGGVFTDVTQQAGVAGTTAGRGASALAFDADGDGALDLFATNGEGPPPGNEGPWQLWRNDSTVGHWVTVRLEGNPENPAAFGARLTARVGPRLLALERAATTSRFATSVLPLHVGIGAAETVDLEIVWPTGVRQTASARAGERLVVRQPPS